MKNDLKEKLKTAFWLLLCLYMISVGISGALNATSKPEIIYYCLYMIISGFSFGVLCSVSFQDILNGIKINFIFNNIVEAVKKAQE